MTFQIQHDGHTFTVHTEVGGDHVTQVVFDDETPEPEPASFEPEEDFS